MMAAFGRDSDTVAMEDLECGHTASCSGSSSPPAPIACSSCPIGRRAHAAPETGHAVGRILLASGGKTVLERELKPGRLVIGRTPDNDLQIDSKFISRHHCQIVTQPDSCLIEDLNSTNGIYVKSKRVRRHNLNDGDVVRGRPARDHVHRRARAARARHSGPDRGSRRGADGMRRCAGAPAGEGAAQPPSEEGKSMVSPVYSRLRSR